MNRRSRVSDRAMASDARTTQVEITLTWGSTVVQTISLCPPRDIHVGDEDCPVPDEPLGVPRLGGVDAAGSDVEDPALQCCLANAQRLWAPRVHGAELRYVIQLRRDG